MKNVNKVEFITELAKSQLMEISDIYTNYIVLGGELSEDDFEKIISEIRNENEIESIGFMYNVKKEKWMPDSAMIKYFNNIF